MLDCNLQRRLRSIRLMIVRNMLTRESIDTHRKSCHLVGCRSSFILYSVVRCSTDICRQTEYVPANQTEQQCWTHAEISNKILSELLEVQPKIEYTIYMLKYQKPQNMKLATTNTHTHTHGAKRSFVCYFSGGFLSAQFHIVFSVWMVEWKYSKYEKESKVAKQFEN